MRTSIVRWGRGAAIRIPAPIMRAARLKIGQAVEIREGSGVVIVAPVRHVPYDLDESIAGITDDNKHDIVSFGEPIGKEV